MASYTPATLQNPIRISQYHPKFASTVALLVKQSKVRYTGVCNYNASQLREARKYVNSISNQVPYSMVKRGIEEEVVPYCLENNISILAYSPPERGLLTGKMKPGHEFKKGDHRAGLYFFNDENRIRANDFLDTIRLLAEEKKARKWKCAADGPS